MRDEAIYKVYPECVGITDGVKAYDSNLELIEIDESLVQAKIIELQAEYDANKYQRDRQPEYPSIQDQLDMQYWDKINGTNNWQEAIQAVKTKYPKPEA